MNDDTLVLSGGGSTAVATDELFTELAVLGLLHERSEAWRAELTQIQAMPVPGAAAPAPTWTRDDSEFALFAAARALEGLAERSAALVTALRNAAEGYGEAERTIELVTRLAGAGFGYAVGVLSPLLAVLALPTLAAVLSGWFIGTLITGQSGRDGGSPPLAEVLARNPRLLTNPELVAAVRVLVSSVDDAAAGLLRIPQPLPALLGDDGIGLLGASTSAAGVLFAANSMGVMRETPVTAVPVGRSRTVAAPVGVHGMAERIPRASADSPQVRIERYGPAERPGWVVYVGGTVDWSPVPSREPWDLTSNIAAVADQNAGSYRAVVDAMTQAGIGPDDPVAQVGHSQGGLIAAQVAAFGDFNTVAVLTFGAPAGQVPVPDAVPMLAVAHTDDLVPALGGTARDTTAAANAHLLVRREVYAETPVPTDVSLPAHGITNYVETARLIDESSEPRLLAFTAGIAALVGAGTANAGTANVGTASTGSATSWRGIRASGDR